MLPETPPSQHAAYNQVLKKLISYHKVTPGLANTKLLLRHCFINEEWSPKRYIHVAGTNGKGSVTWKITKYLHEHHDIKVGTFSSPHILTIRERICINSEMINYQNFINIFDYVISKVNEHSIDASFFEIIFIMSLIYFHVGPHATFSKEAIQRESYCDVIVCETGLGGRLDATNIFERAACSIITSIGWDHVNFLGDTLEKIAYEKFGISRSGCHLILGPTASIFDEVLTSYTNSLTPPPKILKVNTMTADKYITFNEENTMVATEALNVFLQDNRFHEKSLKIEELEQCCLDIIPPCRLQKLDEKAIQKALNRASQILNHLQQGSLPSENQLVYLDVGHNLTALDRVAHDLNHFHPTKNFLICFCLSLHRNVDILEPFNSVYGSRLRGIFYLNSHHHRTRPIETIYKDSESYSKLLDTSYNLLCDKFTSPKPRRESLEDMLAAVLLYASYSPDTVILITGTIFMMQEILQIVSTQSLVSDDFEMNERTF